MAFDVIIMNPPYDRNLHLKILEKVIPMANKVINISPVRWLQDPFAPYSKRSDYCKFENSISKKIESIDMIPANDASKQFDASFTMNLGIYVCGQGGYNYRHNDPLVTKIVEKINESNWSKCAYSKKYSNVLKPYQIIVSGIHSANAKFALLCNTYSAQLQTSAPNMNSHNSNNSCLFDFDTEEERKNFYNCYCHPFIEYICRWWRVNANIYSVKVPYFGDYTHSWDYKDFFEWFDLTKEEQTRVMKEIIR